MQTGLIPSLENPTNILVSARATNLQQCLERIQSLAEEHKDLREQVSAGVDEIARYFDAAYAAIQVDIDNVPVEYNHHRAGTPVEMWQQLCSVPTLECLSSQTDQVSFFIERTTGTRAAVFALPVNATTPVVVGAACLIVSAQNAEAAKRILSEFETLLSAILRLTKKPDSNAENSGSASSSRKYDFLNGFCQGRIWDNPTEFAFEFVNGLCNQLGCLDVSLGMVRNHRVQLFAISGYDSVQRRSLGNLAIEQAMTESLDAGRSILAQKEVASASAMEQINCVLHQALRAKSGNCSCYTFPMIHDGQIVALCTLRRAGNQPFTTEELSLLESHQQRLAEFAVVSSRLGQSILSQLRERARGLSDSRYLSGSRRKWICLSLLGAIGVCLFLPWPHSISVPCTLVSAEQRIHSAPYSGKLSKVFFRSGDWVNQGAVLFEMDTEELLNQKLKLSAERKSHGQAMIRFLQASDTAKAGEERANITALDKELALIDSKLDRAIVRATENGTIIDSDLHRRVGETIAIGEQMFTFAPSHSQQVELKIPDYLGMEFHVGQQGRFATSAEPGSWRSIVLERVEMASTSENGENFIKAIGASSQFDEETRFGLSGYAHISVGNQPGWWILLQQPIRYIQRKVSQL